MGAECVFASEIDDAARTVYELNWGPSVGRPHPGSAQVVGDIGDFVPLADDAAVAIPKHDLLAAGFPCQPFSKSGAQMGVRDRTRGTLFHKILRALEQKRPKIVMLENVRNLTGPRHRHTWDTIIGSLRDIGYLVSSQPTIFSPHFLPPSRGGTPQVRERVFILGVYVGPDRSEKDIAPPVPRGPVGDWDPSMWDVERTYLPWIGGPLLQPDHEIDGLATYRLADFEQEWIKAWDEFVYRLLRARRGRRLPGFPLWVDEWVDPDELIVDPAMPEWKQDFLRKNADFYREHRDVIDPWLEKWDVVNAFPASRRKFEWQAQDLDSLDKAVLQFRPSGIRVKRATYLPALVAITQTSIVGSRARRLTPREAARLQGFPDWFDFGDQGDAPTYKQLGNGVSIGAVYHVLREFIRQQAAVIAEEPRILAMADGPDCPDVPRPSGKRDQAGLPLALEASPLPLTLEGVA